MVRRFFKDSALYGFATILSKGLTVLMVPIYTAFLSKTQLGLLDLLLGAMAVLSMIIGLDISNALAREYGESGDYESKRRYSSTALWFSVGIFGVALALILPGAGSIAHAAFGDGGVAVTQQQARHLGAAGGVAFHRQVGLGAAFGQDAGFGFVIDGSDKFGRIGKCRILGIDLYLGQQRGDVAARAGSGQCGAKRHGQRSLGRCE